MRIFILVVLMMIKKLKRLHMPMILAAVVIWIDYAFIARSISEGVMTILFLLLMIIAMKVEF